MQDKTYRVTINQFIEVQAASEQDAKEYVAENILDLLDWSEVTTEEVFQA